ncbi:hypothetical protein GIB67_022109 [Kingdonia uniflora]|uniref:USP domain-containing protein n=1 Tax=Kingdonia uniflora TaxID=39325 RepID=A0A7J7LXW5_9MAGN|nr:hypothetical protein GIB67_022109 [Kingdonia uniflora]
MAAEEKARVEHEAVVDYYVPVSVAVAARHSQCTVCYYPTSTRCSRCKAIRYYCYANAILQCLAFTRPLTLIFFKGFILKHVGSKKDWCFTYEFEGLILKAKEGISPLPPMRILSHLPSIGSHLGNGRQEDAHEFLRYVIDTIPKKRWGKCKRPLDRRNDS